MLQAVTELFGCGTVHIFGSLAQQVPRDAGRVACVCRCITTDGPSRVGDGNEMPGFRVAR
jgi:hypothetical protein